MTAAATRPTAPDVEARLAALEHAVARLGDAVGLLRRGSPGPRDEADVALLVALADLVGVGDFVAADLAERMRLDSAFRVVCESADIEPDTVGYWLRGMAGAVVGDRVLSRLDGKRPARWAFL